MTNTGFYSRVRADDRFREFVLPMNRLETIRDAMLFIRRDGLVIFSEGYCHPRGKLVGNIIYAPDPAGTKQIFGLPYTSVIKHKTAGNGEESWVDYSDQLEIYRRLAPEAQADKPVFARYKCLFDLEEMVGFVDHRRSLAAARRLKPEIDDSMGKIAGMLGIEVDNIGCTGSMALGNLETAHDFDLVFYGTVREGWKIVDQIYEITKDPKRQVWEYGMFWAIRFYDDWGNLICPFFSYLDPAEIPLPAFEMEALGPDSVLTATVGDDTHTFYMPSVLGLEGAAVAGSYPVPETLVLYHGGLRGEYRRGDRIEARGTPVEIKTPERSYPAFLCTHLNQSRKL